MKTLCTIFLLFAIAFLWFINLGSGQAATTTWTGSSDSVWTNDANWTGNAPTNGDSVIIQSGATNPVMPAGTYPETGSFQSFELQTGATLTCQGDTNAINEASGGTNGGPHGIGVTINVTGNADIDGTINADLQGFSGASYGYNGPGGGLSPWPPGGGSYGGKAGGSCGSTYGSVTNPTALGSGSFATSAGGGAIKLSAGGTLTVNGTISANGASGGGDGGGAGGSVWLILDTFTGGGTIRADGGNASNGRGCGGGGRIAFEYSSSTFTGTVSAASAAGGTASGTLGRPGTIYDPGFPTSGVVTLTQSGQRYLVDSQTYNWDSLTVSNADVTFLQGTSTVGDVTVSAGSALAFSNIAYSITGGVSVAGGSTLTLDAQTYDLSGDLSLLGTNSTIYALGDTNAINAASGGTNGGPHGIGVTINAAGNIDIEGTVSADSKGFAGATDGYNGPGGGGATWGGGSYGGKGGMSSGATYGSVTNPTALGSGSFATSAGGGAIKLSAGGTLTVNGTISANGTSGGGYGGGAGGSVWLISDIFAGGGIIRANGGTSANQRGSGGGGRIAFEYSSSTFTGTVSAAGGTTVTVGYPGTIYDPGFPTSGVVRITQSGQRYLVDSQTYNWDSLTVSNANVTFLQFLQGTSTVGNVTVSAGSALAFSNIAYSITGSVSVAGGSTLTLDARTYDLSGDLSLLGTNSTIYVLGDTNAVNAASGGTNGKPHGIGVTINAAGNIDIEGTVSADSKGFAGANYGYNGPGGGGATWGGGGYGGKGGSSGGGVPYGSLVNPTALGSGSFQASPGGGAIKLSAGGTLTVNGTISVNGVCVSGSEGGGAGGSVWLISDSFTGGGTIMATGANSANGRGSGGGGRIAIEYSSSTFTGTVSAAGGTASVAAETGTWFLCESPWLGASSSGYGGIALGTDFSASSNGVKITRVISQWRVIRPTLSWTDNSTILDGGTVVTNVTTYNLSGVPPNTKHQIYYDGQWTNTLTSEASGNLTNIVITLDAEHTVLVEGTARGTAIIIR